MRAALKFLSCFLILSFILSTNTSAFTKIKPQLAATGVSSDGYFTGVFTNGAGTPIRIVGVAGRIVGASSQCIGTPRYPTDPVQAGDNFRVELSGCAQGLSPQVGDVYQFSIRVDYEVDIAGYKTTHMDGGTIRGPYEESSGKPVVTSPKANITYPKEEGIHGVGKPDWTVKLNPDIIIPVFFILLVGALFAAKQKKISIWAHRKKILAVAAIVILAFIAYSLYILNVDKLMSHQQTLLFAQNQFTQDSVVSFRVVAQDKKTQTPLSGASVLVKLRPVDGGLLSEKTLYSGTTDPSGSAEIKFNLSGEWGEGDYRLSITVGEDTLSEDIRVVRKAKILLTTDKPIYQPNQIIHMRALVLNPFNLKPYANKSVVFEVEDSKANKIFKKTVDTNNFGVASTQLALADDINLGRYTIRSIFDDTIQEKKVEVKKYALPKFKIDFVSDRDYYLPSDVVRGGVSANYFFGKPVENADVDVRILSHIIEFKELQHIQGKTDANGNFDFAVNLPDYFVGLPLEKGNAFVVFNITVTDSTAHDETILRTLPVSSEPINIEAFPESEKLKTGLDNTIFIVTSYPDGTPAQTTLNVNWEAIATNRLGIASFTIKPTGSGMYRLSIVAEDKKGEKTRVVKEFSSEGGAEHVILKADKAVYSVGETAIFDCIYSGTYGTKSVYLDLIKNKQTILTKAMDLENNRATVGVDLTHDMVGTVEVHCYKTFRSTDIVRDVKHMIVNEPKDLEVDVSTDKKVYLPGEEAKISLHVTGEEGGVQSAVGVKIVDESVYALEELQPGFEKIYFIIEQELMTPRTQTKIFSPYELLDSIAKKEPLNLTVVEPVPVVDAEKAAQVLVTVANLSSTDYDIKRDSYSEKEAEIKKSKEEYWSNLWRWGWATIKYGFIIVYLFCFLRGLYWIIKNRNTLLMILLLLTLVLAALAYIEVWDWFGHECEPLLCCMIPITFMIFITSFFAVPAYGVKAVREIGKESKFAGVILLSMIGWVSLFFVIGGIVFWQLGIFSMGSTTLTSMGGIDRSLVAEGVRAPRDAATAEGKPYLRQFFPETLYFNPSIITDGEGRVDVSLQMADSITTWRLDALASTLDGRLGSKTTGIRVFQDFFIDVDLPRILTQDDEIWVPIAAYNYLDKPQEVTLELIKSDWFTLIDDTNKTIILKPNEVSVEFYHIKADKHGMHKITVYAYGTELSDAISRQVEVKPYGEEVLYSVSGALDRDITEEVYIPEYAVNGTEKIMVKIYPGYFSQVVEGLDKILRMPYGCFEQTTSITYPNVLVLDYMKKTGQVAPELQMQAESYVATGYQRLMNFETPTPGGFDWYGNPPPKLLLTAYGLLEFKDMSEVYNVDPDLIPRTQSWLASQQDKDGSWEPKQYLRFSHNMASSRLTSTCFVAWSLAHSGYRGYELNRGISYIKENMDYGESADPYTLALCANALLEKDRNDPQAKRILEMLHETKVEDENNLTYWETKSTDNQYETWTGSRGSMKDLETTALASLVYMKAGYQPQTTYRILNYLITKKDAYGTWSSTQATILSLKAFVYAAEHLKEAKGKATATIHLNGEPVLTVRVDESTSDVVRFIDLGSETKKGSNKLEIKYAGEANLYYQITGKYYSPWERQKETTQPLKINVDYSTKTLKINDMASVNVEVSYSGAGTLKLVIVDLGIPPGFTVVEEDLEGLKREEVITRYDVAGRQLILYVQQLEPNKPLRLSYRVRAQYPIKAKTPESRAYGYYNPEVKDTAKPVELTVTD